MEEEEEFCVKTDDIEQVEWIDSSTSIWPTHHFLADALPEEPNTSMQFSSSTQQAFEPSNDSDFGVQVSYKSLHDTDKKFQYYQCPQCKLFFNSSVQLHEHILGNSSDSNSTSKSKLKCGFFCNICRKRFSILKALKMHELIHDESIANLANVRVSNDEYDVEMAKMEDLPVVNIKCKICFKWLPSLDEMSKHMISHSQFKPFQCKKCDQRFGLETEFKAHSKVHEIPKNSQGYYVCMFCQKAIKGFTPMKRHMENAHNENLCKLYQMKE
jgi:hypothetical protein